MRRFEIIVKPLDTPKLTIAKDRTTLKLPSMMSEAEQQLHTAFAKYIDARVGDIEYTLRGRFFDPGIVLKPKGEHPEHTHTFLYKEFIQKP